MKLPQVSLRPGLHITELNPDCKCRILKSWVVIEGSTSLIFAVMQGRFHFLIGES